MKTASTLAILSGLASLITAQSCKSVVTVTTTVTGPARTAYPSVTTVTGYVPPAPRKTIKVDVGARGNLIYSPSFVHAAIGDVIAFNFFALNHTLSQSSLEKPCTSLQNGFDTGFGQFNKDNSTGKFIKTFVVTNMNPTWFYCRQTAKVSHCNKGMVFGINPAGKMAHFIKNAEDQTSTTTISPTSTVIASPTAITTTVVVGPSHGALRFDPPFLPKLPKGSKIVFDFRFKNHTLTESSFDHPCKKLPGTTIDTNFRNVNVADLAGQNTTTVTIDTEDGKPRWFYCKQGNGTPTGHCSQGMVFAVGTDAKEFGQFVGKANATPGKS